MSRDWSDGEVIALKFMWRVVGMSAHQIGSVMGRTNNSIIGKVARLSMCEQGRLAPGGQPRWVPFQNPRYRPEDDPTHQQSRQDNYLRTAKILPLPSSSPRA